MKGRLGMNNLKSGVAGKTDAVSKNHRGRQFHQLKKRGDGGNILNGCSVGVEAESEGKKNECTAV